MSGKLFIIAVPVGNPDDLTVRARDTLRTVAVVAAEDTRHFATLARHHGIEARAVSYHDHNEDARTRELIGRLEAGDDVALVSDAGTPLVSDPGYRLVRAAIEAGVSVTSLPGASAVTTALAASGLPPHPFRFIGFLPRTASARRAAFDALRSDTATLVAFEAPRRLTDALRDAQATLGDRAACLARSITKPHEQYQRGSLSELIAALQAEGQVRGECTLLIGGAVQRSGLTDEAESDAALLLQADAPARAVQELLMQRHGLSKRDAYALVLRIRDR
ncbi:MAG: 16S rRNA (cytidine(1402)-2'-O)-methyltransferase [Chloroflexota bacterium]|nr:16S rRNA (cytidine(1402)-2'-O)-methyltransferase [Chloroflexota bacterium]